MNQETKDQLREILCEVPEVENDLNKIEYYNVGTVWTKEEEGDINTMLSLNSILKANSEEEALGISIKEVEKSDDFDGHNLHIEVISGLTKNIQERHLRMYCDYINLYLIITTTGMISYIKKDNEMINTGIKLDNTKDLEDQSEETGKKLIKFLLDNK